ncbi:MAG: hypothetical protein HPY50_04225 [Firmicutes bacterium]|nr:hypothetical protein [Bacillota bacterium]
MKQKELTFGLLENGLDFIHSAIKYLINPSNKSDLKYGILHLSAGVDLILKYRLSKEHWTLLFQNVDLANKKDFDSGNFTSVSSKTCIERLKGICSIEIDDKSAAQLKHLRDRRNRLEHFGILDSEIALQVAFCKVLNFALDFIEDNVEQEDFETIEREILEEIRSSLGKFKGFISHRWNTIKSEIEKCKELNMAITNCPTCYQDALVIDDGVKCYFCGYSDDGEKAANEYIQNVLGISAYSTVKDGGEFPLYYCIECGSESMVHLDDGEKGGWICFTCGFDWDESDVCFCISCGSPHQVDVDDIGMCDDCINYRLSRD